jgi:hypothetical protein
MATLRYSIPGVGGSLGACAVCGDTFLKEILLHERVDSIRLSQMDADLPVHKKCAAAVIALQGTWEDIRDRFPAGPMHDCFEEEFQSKKEPPCTPAP